MKAFVDRPSEMAEIERVLLLQRQRARRKIFVLHGLGGFGETKLAVEFARRHRETFSSVFWLDGRSQFTPQMSIAKYAGRIPVGQFSDASRDYFKDSRGDLDAVLIEVNTWLAHPVNTDWLLILDNVNQDFNSNARNFRAYDVRQYFTGADYGSILITTRLDKLDQLGEAQQISKMYRAQS